MSSNHLPRTRRQTPRVSMACHQCRTGRIKCDGVKPQCATCARLDRNCEYSRIDGRKSRRTESEFGALKNRIAFLESQLREAQTRLSLGLGLMGVSTLNTPDEFSAHIDSEELQGMRLDPPLESLTFSVLGLGFGDERLAASALGAIRSVNGALIYDEVAGKTAYVGPTSNLHLSLTHRTRRPSIAAAVTHYHLTEWLPTELEYLESYWGHVHSHFPLFSSAVELQQTAATNLLLKASVLGVGAFFYLSGSDPGRQHQVTLAFLSRFTDLSGGEIEHVCIPNIKSFLLRSYLAVLQGKLESATVFLGIACNAAKLMGLHVDPDSLHNEPYMRQSSDNIDRHITFWACFFLDRRLAILQGRAVLMAACDVSIQSPVHNVERTLKERNDVGVTGHDIYAYHLSLADMQDVCLGDIYSFTCPASTEEAISAGNLRYVSWLAALPASLRATNLPECPPSLISLHLCYHSGMILLHRPSLKQTSAESELANNRCLESASTITTLLKTYRERFSNSVADFMVIHAAFTAALVHLVLLDHPEISSYHKTIRALRSTMTSLAWMTPKSEYAKEVYADLKYFAMSWSIKPANSPMFWENSIFPHTSKQ